MAHGRMLIQPSSTALVVVDLQEKLLPAIQNRESVVENTLNLLRLARLLDLTTLATTQYRKGLGDIIPSIAKQLPTASIDKVSFGCMNDKSFCSLLAKEFASHNTLLLAGVETHICVLQTALGALEAGYNVHVVSDATGSRSAANAQLGLQRMRDAGAVISATEMVIYELLGNSSRAEFKQMLPYLK